MSVLLKALALKLIAGRSVGGLFTLGIALLAPIAGILKFIGLPILLVVGIVGAPLFLILGAVGLPGLFVVGIGGAILLFVGLIAALGIFALKFILPIVLIVWFVRWILRRNDTAPAVVNEPTTGSI